MTYDNEAVVSSTRSPTTLAERLQIDHTKQEMAAELYWCVIVARRAKALCRHTQVPSPTVDTRSELTEPRDGAWRALRRGVSMVFYRVRGDSRDPAWKGHIIRAHRKAGRKASMSKVGVCLKHLPAASTDPGKESPKWHDGNVPWQRVINAKGGISPRGPGGAARQAAALRREGVAVTQNAMGEFSVDFGEYGWFPSVLPSEAEESESSDDEDEEEADAAAYHT